MWLMGIVISSAIARHAMAQTGSETGQWRRLVTPPANLRKLGDKNGMPLPAHKIAEFIDGRDTPRAHGNHEMPVWERNSTRWARGSAASTGSVK